MQSGSSSPLIPGSHLLSWLTLLTLVTGLLLLHPCRLHAHSAEQLIKATQLGNNAVVLDEHLGAKILLDIVLRDEAGKPVRMGELMTVPTIILPVYYSCTNVCVYLQARIAGALQNLGRRPV